MSRESRSRLHRDERGAEGRPRPLRSPALESAERRRKEGREEGSSLADASGSRRQGERADRRQRLAADAVVARPVLPRKLLPRRRQRGRGGAGTPGLVVGWKLNNRMRVTEPRPEPAEVISEE